MEQIIQIVGINHVLDMIAGTWTLGILLVYIIISGEEKVDNNSKVLVASRGIGFGGIFFLILFLLKVGIGQTSVVGWSWWWITLPLWIGPAIFLAIFLAVILFAAIIGLSCMVYQAVKSLRRNKCKRKNLKN